MVGFLQLRDLIADRSGKRRERRQGGRGVISIEIVRFQRFALFTQRRVLAGAVVALRLLVLVAVAERVRRRVEADHVAAAAGVASRMV